MHPGWAWVTDHWILSFILAVMIIRGVKNGLARLADAYIPRREPVPEPEPSEPEVGEEESEPDSEPEPAPEPMKRSRFERI